MNGQGQPDATVPQEKAEDVRCVLGTPLLATTYADLINRCQRLARQPTPAAVDFTNTQIVTLRRHDPAFRAITASFDYFVPDGMPLIWCLNRQGSRLSDRVYGPNFMRQCILSSPSPWTHYFLGGTPECVKKLEAAMRLQQPALLVVGARHGYYTPQEEPAIIEEINRLSPDFIWVGLGTPKQQAWIHSYKQQIRRGVLLAVGFAFDVNAGTKRDAPEWMQRWGLTWLFRLCSEPRRLGWRYLRHNSLFLGYLLRDLFARRQPGG